jgi:hypothetical protein
MAQSSKLRQIISKKGEDLDREVEVIKKYKALFNSELGKEVLADLHKKFGWLSPNIRHGASVFDTEPILLEGMKQPFYHIQWALSVDPATIYQQARKLKHSPQGGVEIHGRTRLKPGSNDLEERENDSGV